MRAIVPATAGQSIHLGETSVGESGSSTGTIAAPTPSAIASATQARHPQPSSSSPIVVDPGGVGHLVDHGDVHLFFQLIQAVAHASHSASR